MSVYCSQTSKIFLFKRACCCQGPSARMDAVLSSSPSRLGCLCRSLETYSPLQPGGLFYFSCIRLCKKTYTGKSRSSLVGLEATPTTESSFNHASPELIRDASAPSNLAFSILISTLIFNYLLLCVISNGFAMPETLQINELLNWSLRN